MRCSIGSFLDLHGKEKNTAPEVCHSSVGTAGEKYVFRSRAKMPLKDFMHACIHSGKLRIPRPEVGACMHARKIYSTNPASDLPKNVHARLQPCMYRTGLSYFVLIKHRTNI